MPAYYQRTLPSILVCYNSDKLAGRWRWKQRAESMNEDDFTGLFKAALSSGRPLREIEDLLDCLENERRCSNSLPRAEKGQWRGLAGPAPAPRLAETH